MENGYKDQSFAFKILLSLDNSESCAWGYRTSLRHVSLNVQSTATKENGNTICFFKVTNLVFLKKKIYQELNHSQN